MYCKFRSQGFLIPVLALVIVELIEPIDNTNQTLAGGFRKGRWGMFFTYEPICTLACKRAGKYSGVMHGGVCRCYCVRSEKLPCTGTYPSCDRLCRQNSYHFGGDCLDDKKCYCTCTVRQRQAPNGTEPSSTSPPCQAPVTPPSGSGSANVPSPGSLGQTRLGEKSCPGCISSKKRPHSHRRKNSTKNNRTRTKNTASEPPPVRVQEPILVPEPPLVRVQEPLLVPEPPLVGVQEPLLVPEPPLVRVQEPLLVPEPPMVQESAQEQESEVTTETPQSQQVKPELFI